MTIFPRKGLLAVAVVVDVALQTDGRPISAKTLAMRHGLPARHSNRPKTVEQHL
jgi:DNA-binding IscR family transcriptional regulator